eukprot:Skav214720  [mRNA]  locus=scaffold2250:237275:240060:+ [translate_table: standard]
MMKTDHDQPQIRTFATGTCPAVPVPLQAVLLSALVPALQRLHTGPEAVPRRHLVDGLERQLSEYWHNDHGDWLAVDYSAKKQMGELSQHFKVEGIPSLIVLDHKGKAIDGIEGRSDVASSTSPEAAKATFAKWKKAAGDWRETAGTVSASVPAAGCG